MQTEENLIEEDLILLDEKGEFRCFPFSHKKRKDKEMKSRINWILHMIKRIKPYSVVQCFDDKGNYEYSVLCLYKRLSGKCDNFIRIKYRADECEMKGIIDNAMRKDILNKEMAKM